MARIRSVKNLYRQRIALLDSAMGMIIYLSVLFAPWAFGTVHDWSILVMNIFGYSLSVVVFVRYRIEKRLGLGGRKFWQTVEGESFSTYLWYLSWLVLVYLGLYVANGRASFDSGTQTFEFFEGSLSWLPHSYDISASWDNFIRIGALICYFWGIRFWLSRGIEFRSSSKDLEEGATGQIRDIRRSRRMVTLLSLLIFNGMLLAIVGILQRLGSNDLLLWVRSAFIHSPQSHFGPYAYRGNAATYFNLIWPLTLFLIFWLRSSDRGQSGPKKVGNDSRILLYPGLFLLIIVPIISNSRTGAVLAVSMVGFSFLWLYLRARKKWLFAIAGSALLVCVTWSSFQLGASNVLQRLEVTFSGNLDGSGLQRLDIYKDSVRIFNDHLVWGTGPGTFSSVYASHRGIQFVGNGETTLNSWAAWAHCDVLEFLVTLGIVGTVLVVACLFILFIIPFDGQHQSILKSEWVFVYLGMVGFCLQSLVDFPFQIYSLVHLFLVSGAVLSLIPYVRSTSPRRGTFVERN